MIATIVDDGHIHQATLDGLEVAWTLDGAFQRQLSYDSILHSVSHAPIEHIVFARFRESSGAETPTVALCVFRPDMLHICYHTGEKFVVALPFGVCRVFSMYIGILVQREYSDATDSGIHTGKLPTIFSLMSPFSEFKMLGLNKTMDLASACRQSRRSFVLSPTAVEGSPMPPIGDQIVGFNDSKSVLVGVATSRRNRSSQFVLCWESSAKKYVLYRCFVAYSSPEADDDTQDALQPADAQHALGQPGSQRHGHRHSSVSAHRRQSTVMARNDSRRSTIGLAITNERRVSILGRASINESPGARSVIDTFWENRQMRAEVVLHECWRERRQRADRSDSAVLKSKVSVMQAVNGDDIVCVLRMGDAPLAIGLDTTRFGEVFKIPATSMASIGATRSELDDLAVVMTSGSLGLVCAGHEPVLYDVPCNGSITQILRVEGSSAVLELEDGSETTVQISIEMTRLSVAIMGALSFVLSPATYATTRRAMITALQDAATADDELECLVSLLLNGCYTQSNIVLSPRAMDEVRARAAAVVSVLHLVYEDMAMRAFEPRARLCKLGKALVQISQQNGLNEIARYYAPIGLPTLSSLELAAAQARRTASVPSFIQWATKALDGSPETATDKFPDFAAIANLYRITDAVPAFGAHSLLTILGTVSEVLMQLASQLDLAEILKPMADLGIDPVMFLPRLAPAYQWLLRALIECSRNQCLLHWPQNILKMLGRNDIVANMSPKSAVFPQRCLSKGNLSDADDEVEPATIAQLCESVIDTASTLVRAEDVIESAVKSQEIGQMCFAQDLRVDEACRLLLVHADVHINVDVSRLESPEEIKQIKDKHLTQVAQRTLSLPVSQALLTFSTRDLDEQDSLAIPQVTVRAKFRGNRMPSIWKPADVDTAWAQFHNGVAVALSLDRDQVRGAHPSWVLLNWPVEVPPSTGLPGEEEAWRSYKLDLAAHAGFLLGMGLVPRGEHARGSAKTSNGPISGLPPWQAFKYLSSRDGLTSIGLLLGCACANRGSMDPAAAKLLSLHIPSLLPPGSSELMLLLHGTQAAAMLGLGLVYAGSQNRRMVEVALRELTACRTAPPSDDAANRLDDADPAESSLECYSLASGFALGLLVLGQGQVTETLADLNLLDTLSGMIGRQGGGNVSGSGSANDAGSSRTQFVSERTGRPGGMPAAWGRVGGFGGSDWQSAEQTQGSINTVSDIGPIAALGLTFLGSNYRPAAQRLAFPSTLQQLRTTDPFVLLWKTLMRCVIMTDSIQPTKAWVESNVPPLGAHPTAQLPQDLMRIRLNTVTAACFAMSLKYAGTEDESAHHTLLVYFDELKQLTSRSAIGYEANLTCASAQACLNILCISSALVMAGSGDISVMKRLRALHAVKRERTYGDYMASHMALGILFLGGGARFTIANTRESMAMLIIALFPRFPRTVADNYEHLQALRHLWAMCVQPRCLVVRDAQSGALCNSASVTLTYEGRSGNVPMIVRPLQRFPDLESVESLSVHASGFLPLEINFSDSPAAKDILTKRWAIYISSSDSPFKSAMVGLTPARFERWLNRTCDSAIELADVVKAAFELKSPGVGQTMDQGKIANILENVRQLRVCVLAARTPGFIRLRKNHIGYEKLQWAERATLAWMDVYARVRLLAKTKNAQQALYTYWANDGLAPDSNEVEHTAVALMYTALDLPAPDDVASVAKEVSLTSLVSYCLR